MVLKIYSEKKIINNILQTFFLILLLVTMGCATTGPVSEQLPEPEKVPPKESAGQTATSRSDASHKLTEVGYSLLKQQDYDGAVRILERAVGINPADGPGYYYLAEAWMNKGNYRLAFQFNRLASIYLRQDRKWAERTIEQKKRIKEMENND